MITDATVFVIDDDARIRDPLELLLTANGFKVRTYSSAESFLQNYDSSTFGCLILDVRMPGMRGLALPELLSAKAVTLPTIIISAHADVATAVYAMKLGSFDFLEKPYSTELLLNRVRLALVHGRASADERLRRKKLQDQLLLLTARELDVLKLVVLGKPSKVIADKLQLSVSTIDNHRARIMKKLNAETTADLTRIALSADASFGRELLEA